MALQSVHGPFSHAPTSLCRSALQCTCSHRSTPTKLPQDLRRSLANGTQAYGRPRMAPLSHNYSGSAQVRCSAKCEHGQTFSHSCWGGAASELCEQSSSKAPCCPVHAKLVGPRPHCYLFCSRVELDWGTLSIGATRLVLHSAFLVHYKEALAQGDTSAGLHCWVAFYV